MYSLKKSSKIATKSSKKTSYFVLVEENFDEYFMGESLWMLHHLKGKLRTVKSKTIYQTQLSQFKFHIKDGTSFWDHPSIVKMKK